MRDSEQLAMDSYVRNMKRPDQVVLVCGGRNFRDKIMLNSVLDGMEIDCIVHGGADGADRMAGEWALEKNIPEIIIPAQWSNFGRGAGPVRNQWMLRFTRVNHVVAFPGSSGTANMILQAEKAGVNLTVIER